MKVSERRVNRARERIAVVRQLSKKVPQTDENPLRVVEPTGNLEADKQSEASAILQAFKQRAKEETQRYKLAIDSEFWFAVCFVTREQKEAFLAATGWLLIGDKYLDGALLADMLGVELPPTPSVMRTTLKRPDKRLLELMEE